MKRTIIAAALLLASIGAALGQASVFPQNYFYAGPTSGSGFPKPRAMVTGDLPSPYGSTAGANSVLSNWTAGAANPAFNTWPACANDGAHALVYINGTGLQCAAITNAGIAPQGRLTLTSNTPVMRSNVVATSTFYYDCAPGHKVAIFDGSNDVLYDIPSCEISDVIPTSSTGVANASDLFDFYLVASGGVPVLCHVTNGSGGGWKSDTGSPTNTARGTGYSALDFTTRAYITNANALTNCYNGSTQKGSITANRGTYVATCWMTAAGAADMNFKPGATAGGANPFLSCSNAYQPTRYCVASEDNTGNWITVTAGGFELANVGGTGVGLKNRVNWVDGLAKSTVEAEYLVAASESTGSNFISSGITFNGTGAPASTSRVATMSAAATTTTSDQFSKDTMIGFGLNFAQAVQKAVAANAGKWWGTGDGQNMRVQACLDM